MVGGFSSMTKTRTPARLATTAIIAALAMSTTPLMAQDAPAPDTSVDTPASTSDPLAPEPSTDTSVAPETTVAPEAAPAASESRPAPKAKAATTKRAATTARPAPSAKSPAPAPVADAVPTPADASATPVAPPVAEATPVEPAPPVRVEPAASRLMQQNVIPMIAAAGAILLLALAGLALALRRRRRRREELFANGAHAEVVNPAMTIEPEPEPAFVAAPAAAPVAAMTPMHDPVPSASATPLPEGFDLSRFGPHMQAAYRGPTPDNPSLSLRHRLSKAAAMDQRERANRAEGDETARQVPAETVMAKPEPAPAGSDFMLGRPGTRATVRRAYSE
jgi:hypothetical protein